MSQINHVFGDTLEFSTTVRNGKIESQELVSSNNDCIISFKLDKNFLCPKVLRDLANKIDAEKGVKLVLASQEQSAAYLASTKGHGGIVSDLFASSTTAASLAIAEYMANVDGFTMYESRVTPSVIPGYRVLDNDLEDENDDIEEYDEDDEDEEYEDDYCGCGYCHGDYDYEEDEEDDELTEEEGYKTL